uniref:PTC1-like winged helix-turn-helix domain-containing protein n=1 Tax=Oryza punctata TaxID=4537 RepID=A0A0E0MPR3_ORYPU
MTAAVNASRVMRRRAAGEDLGGDGDFWAGGAPRLYDFSQQEQKPFLPAPPSPAPVAASPPSAAAESVAPCLLSLQCSGVGWGVRKRVRYVGRHLARHALSLPAAGDDGDRAVDAAQEDDATSSKAKKKDESPKVEATEEDDDDHKVATTTEKKKKRKRGRGRARGRARGVAKRPKKEEEEKKTLPAPKAEHEQLEEEKVAVPAASGMIDRWKATRYATAEASLLAIMRAHGARAGKPIPRGELRKEARAHIGDTGLLDHLLRHIADKVAPGGAERFRRRHNGDGALEYWLEPAELVAVRRKAGVADPYWVPPPGWKPGDPVSPEGYLLEVKKQVEQLAVELSGVKRLFLHVVSTIAAMLVLWHMDHLTSNVSQVRKEMKSEADKSYNSCQEKYSCMEKANDNLEKQLLSLEEKYENATHANGELKEELLFLKEKYVSVVENNTRLEHQFAALSTSFLSMKEELLWLEKEEADLYVKEPWEGDDEKQDDDDAGKEATDEDVAGVGAANHQPDVDGDGTTTSNGGTDGQGGGGSGKRTSRKCSVRISKPQGTFQWPTPSLPFSPELAAPPSPPLTPTAPVAGAANFATMDELYEYMMAGGLPTPPSASSTTKNAGKLPLLPAATACTSPVKTAALELDAGGDVGTELALATPAY